MTMIVQFNSGPVRRAGGAQQEVFSMSDIAHSDRRPRLFAEHRTLESRAMFGACYALFLARAVLSRLMPWRKRPAYRGQTQAESVFSEAQNAASVMVASSFMGL